MVYLLRGNSQAGGSLKRTREIPYFTDEEIFVHLSIIHSVVEHDRKMCDAGSKMSKLALQGIQSC